MVRSLKVSRKSTQSVSWPVSCPCAWLDDDFVRDAGTCTSVNGESKGESSGKDIEDVVLSLWNVLQSFQVVRVGSAACTAFIGSFFAAVACRRATAFLWCDLGDGHRGSSGSCVATLCYIAAFCTPFVESLLLQAAAALCYPNALVDVLSTPFVGFFSILVVWILAWSGFVLGLRISCMRLVETTSRIRFHGLRFWFLRLLGLANSFWDCWTWNACACAFGGDFGARMGSSSVR